MPHGQATESFLKSLVTGLWQGTIEPRDRAALDLLTAFDWLVLGGWDIAAVYGPPSGRLAFFRDTNRVRIADSWGKPVIDCELVPDSAMPSEGALLAFRNRPVALNLVRVTGFNPIDTVNRDPWSLIVALELIAYRLDAALLKPRSMREDDLSRLASCANLETEHFRRLCAWYPQVDRYVAEEQHANRH